MFSSLTRPYDQWNDFARFTMSPGDFPEAVIHECARDFANPCDAAEIATDRLRMAGVLKTRLDELTQFAGDTATEAQQASARTPPGFHSKLLEHRIKYFLELHLMLTRDHARDAFEGRNFFQ
jgi:hypothetical protein